MRTVGLDERLGDTAQAGLYGRMCFLWKGQMERLERKGIDITLIQEVEEAKYLCYISWLHAETGTFAADLYALAKEHTTPVFCPDLSYTLSYLKQVSNMMAMSAVISIENKEILYDLLNYDFDCISLSDAKPFVVYVDWSQSSRAHSVASAYRSSAINFFLAVNHF